MSRLARIITMFLAWLVFTVVAFYACVQEPCCTGGLDDDDDLATAIVVDDDDAAAVSTDYGIASSLGAAAVFTGTEWPAVRDALLDRFGTDPTQVVNVYGYYYEGEPAPAGFENMGLARAAEIKDLLVAETDIPADQINPLAKRLDTPRPEQDARWQAGEFSLIAAETATAASAVEELEDEIVIRFPFNEAMKSVEPAVADYLEKLADRLQSTDENVTITGHTDNVDTDAFNMRLGQRRADFVKTLLVRNGAPAARITTRSEGESNPVATNSTAAGRQQNRRAVVKLMQ